jgi:hypothetical protein
MDDTSMDKNYPVKPAEKHEAGSTMPLQEGFENPLDGPRKHAKYFDDITAERYPVGLDALVGASISNQTPKEISQKLKAYEEQWLPYLSDTEKKLQLLASTSPEILLDRGELLLHKINKCIMSQWHEVLGIPRPKKNREAGLYTSQIKLAVESTLLLSTIDNFEDIDFLDSELNNIDAMIMLLQRSIDGEPMNEPQVYVPHPKIGLPNQEVSFLKFEPTDNNSFIKSDISLSDVIEPGHIPGSVAIDVLNKVRINEVARQSEFQDKAQFHKLVLAHQKARLFSKKPTEHS